MTRASVTECLELVYFKNRNPPTRQAFLAPHQPLSADSECLRPDSRLISHSGSCLTADKMRLMPAKTESSHTENHFNGSAEQKPDSS